MIRAGVMLMLQMSFFFFLRGGISKALVKCSCLSVIGAIAQLDASCHFERQENKLEPNWD